MGLDARQFRDLIVRPVLAHLALPGGEAAERLVLGTAAHESDGFRYIDQNDAAGRVGPALGLFQMERLTFDDMMSRFLLAPSRLPLRERVLDFVALWPDDLWLQLAGNHFLACALCRVRYYARPFALTPDPSPAQLARWWKVGYNSAAGAGREEDFVRAYSLHVAPLY